MIKVSEDLNLTPLEVVSLIDSQIGGTYERKDALVKIYVNLNEEQKRFAQGVGSGRFMVATIMDMVLRSESTLLGFIGQIGLIRRQLFGEDNFDTQAKPKVVETKVEPEVKTVVEPKVETKVTKPKVTKPKPKVEVKPVVEVKPKEIVEVKTEPKVEPKVETQPVVEPEKTQTKPEIKSTRRSKVAENLREGIGEVVVTNTLIDDFM